MKVQFVSLGITFHCTEWYVFDAVGFVGLVGGTLGMCICFSFIGLTSTVLDFIKSRMKSYFWSFSTLFAKWIEIILIYGLKQKRLYAFVTKPLKLRVTKSNISFTADQRCRLILRQKYQRYEWIIFLFVLQMNSRNWQKISDFSLHNQSQDLDFFHPCNESEVSYLF